jgi:hypothetical protein
MMEPVIEISEVDPAEGGSIDYKDQMEADYLLSHQSSYNEGGERYSFIGLNEKHLGGMIPTRDSMVIVDYNRIIR